ncbi:MAG: hypothetical protein JNN30_20890 [Rhodanobacteraceae bacterium]|nr:hypothetical protein [Rhodanobacteraceae bacterium]
MRSVNTWLLALLLACGMTTAAAAIPGELDPGFGAGGIRRTSYGDNAGADDLVVDRYGFVYTAGTSTTAGVTRPVLAKYKPDGNLDTSFGSGGIVTPASVPANVAAYSALTSYQGTLYQMIATEDKLHVYAFSTNGIPQSWFGTGGVASFTVGANIFPVFDIAQWGNYLAMAASARNPATGNLDFVVVELTLGGAPVAGFGTGGIAYSRLWTGAGARNRLTGILFQPDGRIVAAGRSAKPGERYDFVAVRYRYNGIPDATFGVGGFSVIDFSAGDDYGRRIAQRKDGRFVIAGSTCGAPDPVTGYSHCRVGTAGIRNDGSLDPAYGGLGRFLQDIGGGGAIVTDLIFDELERPIIVGQHPEAAPADTGPDRTKAFVMRLRSTGGLDGSYLGGGWADFSYGHESSSNGGVKRYPGIGIVTAGTTTSVLDPSTVVGPMTVARHVN